MVHQRKRTLLVIFCSMVSLFFVNDIPKAQSEKMVIIGTHVLNVREGPNTTDDVIAQVNVGETFQVLEEKYGWLKIEINSSQYGWIAGQFTYEKEKSEEKDTLTGSKVTLLYDGTNIRSKPGLHSAILGQSQQGKTYQVLGQIGNWYQIQVPGYPSAYVANWVVKKENNNASSEMSDTMLAGKTIVIDPGHGGKDSGTIGHSHNTLEKQLTLRTSLNIAEKLSAAGAKVILTRADDHYTDLDDRVEVAEDVNADTFLSIHYNSFVTEAAKGITTFFYHEEEEKLAEILQDKLIQHTTLNNRGIRHGNYIVLRTNEQPAVLLELGFLSNPAEQRHVQKDVYQNNVADAVVDGLKSYFGVE